MCVCDMSLYYFFHFLFFNKFNVSKILNTNKQVNASFSGFNIVVRRIQIDLLFKRKDFRASVIKRINYEQITF